MALTRILSIDGGGIKGIIAAKQLVLLEKLLKKHSGDKKASISQYFDIIAGTSTGGILAALLLCPDDNNPRKNKFSAEDALNFYIKYGDLIFHDTFLRKISSLFGLIGAKYSPKNLERQLNLYFGEKKLSELLKPCLITSYDIKTKKCMFFNQIDAISNSSRDYLLKDIIRATSAAPTYFPVAGIKSFSDDFCPLIDGGVFANNPALCAYAEASKLEGEPTVEDMAILSLGNASNKKSLNYKKSKAWGTIQWVVPLLEILMDGVSQTVDYQLKTLFRATKRNDYYLRIETSSMELQHEIPPMDCTKKENLDYLEEIGDKLSQRFYFELDEFARLLVMEGKITTTAILG